MKSIFVSGIGTDIGKTILSSVIVKALDATYWKPVQCGSLSLKDSDLVRQLTGCTVVPERYLFEMPASPYEASLAEDCLITNLEIPEVATEYLIIEGAGGLYVPLTKNFLMIDQIKKWNIPVILVSRNYVGAINHTLLSIESLKQHGINDYAVVFSGGSNSFNERFIIEYSGVKSLGNIPEMEKITSESIHESANLLRGELIRWIQDRY